MKENLYMNHEIRKNEKERTKILAKIQIVEKNIKENNHSQEKMKEHLRRMHEKGLALSLRTSRNYQRFTNMKILSIIVKTSLILLTLVISAYALAIFASVLRTVIESLVNLI